MLWWSWHTVEAIAPAVIPKPRTKPVAMLPFFPCRSTTAIRIRSRPASGRLSPSTMAISSRRCAVMILPSMIPMTSVSSRLPPLRKSAAATRGAFTDAAADLRHRRPRREGRFVDHPPAAEHQPRVAALEAVHRDDVGPQPRRDQPAVAQPEGLAPPTATAAR